MNGLCQQSCLFDNRELDRSGRVHERDNHGDGVYEREPVLPSFFVFLLKRLFFFNVLEQQDAVCRYSTNLSESTVILMAAEIAEEKRDEFALVEVKLPRHLLRNNRARPSSERNAPVK